MYNTSLLYRRKTIAHMCIIKTKIRKQAALGRAGHSPKPLAGRGLWSLCMWDQPDVGSEFHVGQENLIVSQPQLDIVRIHTLYSRSKTSSQNNNHNHNHHTTTNRPMRLIFLISRFDFYGFGGRQKNLHAILITSSQHHFLLWWSRWIGHLTKTVFI